jgi:hypothetical protein
MNLHLLGHPDHPLQLRDPSYYIVVIQVPLLLRKRLSWLVEFGARRHSCSFAFVQFNRKSRLGAGLTADRPSLGISKRERWVSDDRTECIQTVQNSRPRVYFASHTVKDIPCSGAIKAGFLQRVNVLMKWEKFGFSLLNLTLDPELQPQHDVGVVHVRALERDREAYMLPAVSYTILKVEFVTCA